MGEKPHRRASIVKRVLVVVEGQTEERFIKDTLAPHLFTFNKALIPKIVATKRPITGPHFKGGGDFSKLEADVRRLLGDTDAAAITTFYDYYGFPQNFSGMRTLTQGLSSTGATQLEAALDAHFQSPRFKAYIQLHEFEAFLFVDAAVTAKTLLEPQLAKQIAAIREEVQNAESINDGPTTSPSKRISALSKKFQKVLHGPTIAGEVGLVSLRKDCPRFDSWVSWLEKL